ncbi:MAG TPA: ATP-binding protein, partial [Usitatibacter sp.]
LVNDVNALADGLVNILNQAHQNERLLSEAQRLGHVGSWYSDMTGRVSWSTELHRIYGVPDSFVPTDESVLGLVHPDDRPAMKAWLAECAVGQKPRELEYRVNHPDGTLRHFRCHGDVAIDAETGRVHMAGTVQDITEEKRIEQMKSEFVSTVSHELRTPLTSIRGSLGLLVGGVAGPLPDAARSLVVIAESNCQRLIRLVNDILDSEKIESGKMAFEMRAMALGPLLDRVAESNESLARASRVTLRVISPPEPILGTVDGDRFIQLVTNLVSNAVKFSPADAAVEIELSRRASGRARIEVRDRGPGIPKEFHSRMFQRFSQADASSSRARSGTGLGLSIAKSIVERLGGDIGFESAPGLGTTFFVELPVVAAAQSKPLAAVEAGET